MFFDCGLVVFYLFRNILEFLVFFRIGKFVLGLIEIFNKRLLND